MTAVTNVDAGSVPDGQMLRAALAYASKFGWPVFPVHSVNESGSCSCGRSECANAGKHPLTPNGFKDATTDPGQIRKLWEAYPDANIGVPTGGDARVKGGQ